MKTKEDIVGNWLPRYTDTPLDGFGNHVLLTNFRFIRLKRTLFRVVQGF